MAILFAKAIQIKDINATKNPPIIMIPKIGITSKFDIRNVKDTVLKLTIIIGIIANCAAIGTLIVFANFIGIFIFKNTFVIIGVKKATPKVPK